MRTLPGLIRACVVLLTLAAARQAAADPIHITGGFLDMNPTFGPIVVAGDRGFTFSSAVDVAGGIFLPWQHCNSDPNHCRAGNSLNLGAGWSGNDLTGTATLDAVTYTHVGGLNSPSSMDVHFSGTAVLPAFLAATTSMTAPFLFDGTFIHPVGGTGLAMAADAIAGAGTVTLTLSPDRGFPGVWRLDHARYDFLSVSPSATPTPEPGALLLLGSGLLGLAAVFRVRGRRPRAR